MKNRFKEADKKAKVELFNFSDPDAEKAFIEIKKSKGKFN